MAEEYIKYIRDLEGVSRPVRDAELAEEVANIDTDIGDKIDEINKLINALNEELEAVKNGGAVTRVGTSNVGSNTRHIYLDGGTPTASNANVGSYYDPAYVSNGQLLSCGGWHPMYANDWYIESSDLNPGETETLEYDFNPIDGADGYWVIPYATGWGNCTSATVDAENHKITFTVLQLNEHHSVFVHFWFVPYVTRVTN